MSMLYPENPNNTCWFEGCFTDNVREFESKAGVKVCMTLRVFKVEGEGDKSNAPTLQVTAWDELGQAVKECAGKPYRVRCECRNYRGTDGTFKTEFALREFVPSTVNEEDRMRLAPGTTVDERKAMGKAKAKAAKAQAPMPQAQDQVPSDDDFAW